MLGSIYFLGFLLLPVVFSHHDQLNGWNELLYSDGLFDVSRNDIQVKSTDSVAVLSELNAFLSQDTTAEAVYSRYRALFKEDRDTSPLRMDVFKQKLVQIAAHNLEANSGKHSWWMGVNQFTDMVPVSHTQEWIAPPSNQFLNGSLPVTSVSGIMAPATLNNVVLGKVSPAKNTNGMSSQLFAITAVVETSRVVHNNDPTWVSLSEQQLVDCPEEWCVTYSFLCQGTQLETYLTYLRYAGAISAPQYPNANPPAKGACRQIDPSTILKAEERPFTIHSGLSEGQLMEALADKGAAIVSIYVSDQLRDTYRKGVYPGTECGSNAPNRAVAVVGYDSEGGQDYWIIKNSWGQKWGEQGFLKLARNGNNVCGLLTSATTINMG